MTSVITGDIINSRVAGNPKKWLSRLKETLSVYGKSPRQWEIYRGDSFQVEVAEPQGALLAALRIKAGIKSIKSLDVRMAIGIGGKTYDAGKVSESNGEAFINSGEKFESLKKLKQLLAIKTPWASLDTEINLMLSLGSIAMDKWTPSSGELVYLSLENDTLSQKELGDKIKRTQSSVSERQKRAHYEEIRELEAFFRNRIQSQLDKL